MRTLYSAPLAPPDTLQQKANDLRAELAGLFQIARVDARSSGRIISFAGQLLQDADTSYEEMRHRFRTHGYTPLLRRDKGEDIVLAMEGLSGRARTGNPLINILLFAATVATTLSAGSALLGEDLLGAVMTGSPGEVLRAILAGAPFAITLLGILGVHELGHYFAARLHGVRATLPYFIPLPIGGLGTLGAFIAIRSPMRDRKVLYDIGLAGPLAGFVVALPLLVLGLLLSDNSVPLLTSGLTLRRLGGSILVDAIVELLTDVPPNRTLAVHPIFYAAWLGILLTGINLLPVGQLDGGHVTYALLGRFAHTVAILTFILLIVAGRVLSPNWYVWAFFIMFGGLRHPPPLNDISDVGLARKLIGLLTVILFVLIFTPVPLR